MIEARLRGPTNIVNEGAPREQAGGSAAEPAQPPGGDQEQWPEAVGRTVRWTGGTAAGVLIVGALCASCGAVSFGAVAAIAGVAGVAAGLGSVMLALASAVGLGLVTVARHRRGDRADACRAPDAGAERGRDQVVEVGAPARSPERSSKGM